MHRSRERAYIIVFALIWGVWEMFGGAVVHALNLPFKGIFMTLVAVPIILTARTFVPVRGSTLKIGVIVAIMKIFSPGGFVLSPFLAILIESVMAEVILTLTKSTPLGYVLTGGFIVMWSPLHRLLIQGLLFSRRIYYFYLELVKKLTHLVGLPESKALYVFAGYLVFLFLIGALEGFVVYRISKKLKEEVKF